MLSFRLVFVVTQAWNSQCRPLSAVISEASRGFRPPIPDLSAPPCQSASGSGRLGDVLSLQLLRRLSVIYCTSIRQQER